MRDLLLTLFTSGHKRASLLKGAGVRAESFDR